MSTETPGKPTAKRRRLRMAAKALATVVAVWVVGDFVYSRVIAFQVSRWEASVDRDGDGVLVGCAAYNVTPDAGPERGALLFVHGINASPRHYEKMAGKLAELGYHGRVMRLPGFCQPIPDYAQSRRKDWLEAIDKEARRLRDDHARVGIVAHSLGGAATIGHLTRQPDSVDFAALLAPAVAVSNARSPVLSTRTWHGFGDRTLLFTTVLRSPFGIDCHDPAGAGFPGRTPFTPRSVVDELFAQIDENLKNANQLRTPLLMVLTEEDRVVDWQAAQRYFETVPAETKELLMLEDSGHAIPIDHGWEETATAIDRFATQIE